MKGLSLMGETRFLSMRDLRTSTGAINQILANDGKIIVTNNGKPTAIMLEVNESNLEDTLADIKFLRARRALRESRMAAIENGTDKMTMDEINAEIAAYRKECEETN